MREEELNEYYKEQLKKYNLGIVMLHKPFKTKEDVDRRIKCLLTVKGSFDELFEESESE